MRTLTLCRPLSAVVLAGGLMIGVPATARAQAADTTVLTSLTGVYTPEQATKGKDIAAAACLSCHKPAEHTGPRFWDTLVNRSIWDFFSYLKKDMPQDNPGSLGDEDYAAVVSYIFSLNSMPAGTKPLPTDSVSLSKIKVVAPAPSAPPSTTRTTSKGPGK
jgi:mono/diheme cytochrome c family protein